MSRPCNPHGGEVEFIHGVWVSQKERDSWENLEVGWRIILWYVDPLLENNREINNYTTAVTK
jgi:hypothetical protein